MIEMKPYTTNEIDYTLDLENKESEKFIIEFLNN